MQDWEQASASLSKTVSSVINLCGNKKNTKGKIQSFFLVFRLLSQEILVIYSVFLDGCQVYKQH